ncbi:MAG: hypothetical protein WCO23_03500 [bacterium]
MNTAGALALVTTSVRKVLGKGTRFKLTASHAENHGTRSLPPEEEIRKYVEAWIGRTVWFSEEVEFHLTIRSFWQARDTFTGIKIVGLRPNTTENIRSLWLVIGIPGHDRKYQAYLDCGNGNAAHNLLQVANANLYNLLVQASVDERKKEILAKVSKGDGLATACTTESYKRSKELAEIAKFKHLNRRGNVRKLSYLLWKQSTNNEISREVIIEALIESQISYMDSIADELFKELIARGLIFPVTDSGRYILTDITYDKAEQHRQNMLDEEIQKLAASADRLAKNISLANTGIKEAEKTLTERVSRRDQHTRDLESALNQKQLLERQKDVPLSIK